MRVQMLRSSGWLAFILFVSFGPAAGYADDVERDSEGPDESEVESDEGDEEDRRLEGGRFKDSRRSAQLLGLQLDIGASLQPRVSYNLALERRVQTLWDWVSLGPDAGLVFDEKRLRAAIGQVMLRVGRIATHPPGGLSAEMGLGAGVGDGDWSGVGQVGAFMSFRVFEIGAVYQFPTVPLERPEWLESIFFTVRAQLPVTSGKWRDP